MVEVQDSVVNKNAQNLYQIFVAYKERLRTPGFMDSLLFIFDVNVNN